MGIKVNSRVRIMHRFASIQKIFIHMFLISDARKLSIRVVTTSPYFLMPCFPSLQLIIMQKRATGIADHILPLGDLLNFKLVLHMSLKPQDSNPNLEAQIQAWRFKSMP